MDLEMLKEIPGYKAILKAVLKSQIQMLVEQLSSQTEEESIILTASLSDGTLYHLGSTSGKDFLEGREEIKSQFLFHCLNRKTRSPEPTQDQIYMPPVTSPSDVVYPQERRPAKKPRRTLPLASGRGRKPRSQIQAGASNLKRPRYSPTATITRPVEESAIPGYTDNETRTVPGPDLVTVKAENFELNIDLNDKSAKPNEAPVDNNLSNMDIVNQPKKTVPVPTSLTQSLDIDQGDLDMNTSVGDVRNPASEHEGDTVTNVKVNLVPVKVEAPDDFEITGMEPGASQDMYGVPGPSGDMGSPSWAPMGSGGMETESFASGADGQSEESFDYSSQSSGSIAPVFRQFWGEHGLLRIPQPSPRKYAMKRKLVQKTIAEKYEAILEVERGEHSKTEIARMFDVPLSTLSGWIKDAETIKDGFGKFGPGRCTMRKGNFQELETELFKWCTEMLDKNIHLSGPVILEKARSLADQLGTKDCKLSNGWLERFKERHGFKFKKFQGLSFK